MRFTIATALFILSGLVAASCSGDQADCYCCQTQLNGEDVPGYRHNCACVASINGVDQGSPKCPYPCKSDD
ncbi:unnamed protein product [Zymoseptoria tritici ST99CH_1A5]|uniref:Uncharacterized protein n=1 Tax=Zymoseptoria tritici ST99CH_1A5 TaxID=1276529 RepID=A0A1Y6LIN5_ZYMTR|nr:unnamed protein product [Zymoseptoria tritici ST99CH_1A5]